MSRKTDFALWCCEQVGRPALMSAKGDFYVQDGILQQIVGGFVYDCSGLFTCGLKAMGYPDIRDTHNAQRIADSCPPASVMPEPGDVGFYGKDWEHVTHIVIALAGGHLVSADGATKAITTLAEARKAGAQVRFHAAADYRRDTPFLGWRRNNFLDGPKEEPHERDTDEP